MRRPRITRRGITAPPGPIQNPAAAVSPAPDAAGHAPIRYVISPGVRALPDSASIARERALRLQVGLSMQGVTGTAYGYDRGDPATSLTGPVKGPDNVPLTNALAAVHASTVASAKPGAVFSDMAFTDPKLDPFNALLWQRMVARS